MIPCVIASGCLCVLSYLLVICSPLPLLSLVGCAVGPTIMGSVSSLFDDNLRYGFMAALILPLILVICTIIYKWQINMKESVAKL